MRFLRLLFVLPIAGLAACAHGTTNMSAGDPCYNVYYHSFYDNNAGGINNRTEALTTLLRSNAPPGCSIQTATVHSPGIGVEAVKTMGPALLQAGGFMGGMALLRPPYSNIQNGTGSTFSGGQGGYATATGGSATARGGSAYAGASNGGVRVNNSNTNNVSANAHSYSNASSNSSANAANTNYNKAYGGQGGSNYGGHPGWGGGSGNWNQNHNWNGGGGYQGSGWSGGSNTNWNSNYNGNSNYNSNGFMPIMN